MNPSAFASSAAAAIAGNRDLFYLAVAGACLLAALHYLRRAATPLGPMVRVATAASLVAMLIGAALVLLMAAAIGRQLR